ncbi:glycosyltransferase family 4 protein [Flavobacterium aquidurense]|uniref:glycosyltransferase family 4 protein n=1 Tax=Flavobacterium aquidurense TaxID=362413 RepID=UPI00371356C6
MEKTRVLYIINHSAPYGSNKALLNILDEVVQKDILPYVVTGFENGICTELDYRNISYYFIPHKFSVYPQLKSLRDVIFFFPRLVRDLIVNYNGEKKLKILLKDIKPEIIHTNIGPDHIGFNVAKKAKIPHVWHIREYQDLYFNMRPLFSMRQFIDKLQSKGNYPIAITEGIFKHYLMLENARVISDGVMKESNLKFETVKEKYFLFVGRIEEEKGVEMLIKAYVEFCENYADFDLFLAGDVLPDYKLELDKMINEAKLTEKVHFLGFRTDVPDLMTKATALVVPSRFEGFGFITVEAMFNGCLVIGNDSGGTREILKKDNLGVLYSNHDELVKSLETIALNGIESYFPIIKKAQEQALSLYSKEKSANKIYELYQEILKSN